MGGISNDRHVVVTENKESPNFHTPGWMSMIVDMTPVSGKNKKCFLDKSASSIK